MAGSRDHNVSPVKDADATTQACNAALTEFQRGLKAITFYPESHPLREEILSRAYHALVTLMKEGGVSLIAQRSGLSFADREVPIENSPMTVSLAKELFSREVQQLTLLPELTIRDFTEFLSLLALDPGRIIAEGGVTGMLKARGIQTIIANEIDITAVFSKKTIKNPDEEAFAESSVAQNGSEAGEQYAEATLVDDLNNLGIEELIALLQTEADDERYCQLANYLNIKGQPLKKEGNFDRLFPVLPALLSQHSDKMRSSVQRESAFTAFRQLAREEMAEHLLDHLEDKDFTKQEAVFLILGKLGEDAASAIVRRIMSGHDVSSRKALSAVLQHIGPPAVPQLIEVLKDSRWQIVRTAVTILGDIGSRDAVQGLAQSAYHADSRVRVEAIRSLARIGGRDATLLLLDLLNDKNQAIRKQVISWMGNTRNEKALEPLLHLLMKQDFLGKSETIKKEALLAIGRIGDQRALEPLYRLVKKNHWIGRGRWEELKILAIETIGQLGGESSKELLGKLSARGGRIGKACVIVLETMGQRN